MTTITVTVAKTTAPLPAGVTFAATSIAVVDNSGAKLPAVSVNGTETPPWTAVFTGAVGTAEASATIQDLDTNGNPIGNPIVVTETGTGGQPATFQQSASATISVT
ncbi:MAG TPA: hypothetical protein VLH80_07310 [Nitrospiraceae bacterium]|nr:hypothetical protein [Nitrospiraceae bacterium]